MQWKDAWKNGWLKESVNKWTNERTKERTNERTNEWMNQWASQSHCPLSYLFTGPTLRWATSSKRYTSSLCGYTSSPLAISFPQVLLLWAIAHLQLHSSLRTANICLWDSIWRLRTSSCSPEYQEHLSMTKAFVRAAVPCVSTHPVAIPYGIGSTPGLRLCQGSPTVTVRWKAQFGTKSIFHYTLIVTHAGAHAPGLWSNYCFHLLYFTWCGWHEDVKVHSSEVCELNFLWFR